MPELSMVGSGSTTAPSGVTRDPRDASQVYEAVFFQCARAVSLPGGLTGARIVPIRYVRSPRPAADATSLFQTSGSDAAPQLAVLSEPLRLRQLTGPDVDDDDDEDGDYDDLEGEHQPDAASDAGFQ